ncbi:MAG: hypothetical protein JZU65_12360 [Chlorobium sp.]|nr:hypothetical protein [Chlorobium sp.]
MSIQHAEKKPDRVTPTKWRVPCGTKSIANGPAILSEVMNAVKMFEDREAKVNTGKGGRAEKQYKEFKAYLAELRDEVIVQVKKELEALKQKENISYLEYFYPGIDAVSIVMTPSRANRMSLQEKDLVKLYGEENVKRFQYYRTGRYIKTAELKTKTKLMEEYIQEHRRKMKLRKTLKQAEDKLNIEHSKSDTHESDIANNNRARLHTTLTEYDARDKGDTETRKLKYRIRTHETVQEILCVAIEPGLINKEIRTKQLKQLREPREAIWLEKFYGKSKELVNDTKSRPVNPRQDFEFTTVCISKIDTRRLIATVDYLGMTIPEFVWEIADTFEGKDKPEQQAQVRANREQFFNWYIAAQKISGPKVILPYYWNPSRLQKIANTITDKDLDLDLEVYRIYEKQIRSFFRRKKTYVPERFERITGIPWK